MLFFIVLIGIFVLVGIIAIPVGIYKVFNAKTYICPGCENAIRFAANYGKCPKCRTKIFKHGDGTLHVRT